VLKEIFAVIYKKLPIFYEENNILEIVEYSKGEKTFEPSNGDSFKFL
jgi:hypothetical protein